VQVEKEDDFSELRRAEATGRPLGAPEFDAGLENLLGRKIARRAPWRKPISKIPAAGQLELLWIGIVSPDFDFEFRDRGREERLIEM
jgi:hypothetical protein